ncbi:hypothetical protein ACTWQN_33070 [Saccharopolyspora sp. 5N708]
MGDSQLQRMAGDIGRSVAINAPSAHLVRASRRTGVGDEVRAILRCDPGSAVIGHAHRLPSGRGPA